MNVTVASTFRDAGPYLDGYLDQAEALRDVLLDRGDTVRFLWGENDSVDETPKILRSVGWADTVDVSTGAPYYQSAETHQKRWENVATFCNRLLDHLTEDTDVLLWVEADLIWEPPTAVALIDQAPILGVVAAPVWHHAGFFYDTWTSMKDGSTFIPPANRGVVRADSSAGMLAVRGDLARTCRYSPVDAVRGWCRDMGGVWIDTEVKVTHP